MDIYYENSAGIRLDLDRPPYNMLSATSLIDSGGTSVNIFRFRDSSRIFDRIPPGTLPVYWNGAYDFDLRLYEERGEPVWM